MIYPSGAGVIKKFSDPYFKRPQRRLDDNQLNFDTVNDYFEFRDPNKHQKDFVAYIKRTQDKTFNIIGENINITVPYKHRWVKCYRKGVLAKFISLGHWAKRHKLSSGMISLTSAQSGYTDFEILEKYKEAWIKLSANLRKMKYQYIMMFEPHESGLPHIHVLIFGECSQNHMDRMEHLWVEKYNMNDDIVDKYGQQHAFQYESGLKENIESIVNYLMKYLSKTIVSDIVNNEMMVRFHSLFFQTGSRLFTSSRYLSYVMKRKRTFIEPVQAIFCDNVEIFNKYTSKSFPCKYQQIDGIRYKYELLPFEIKPKVERKAQWFKPFESEFIKNTSMWFEMQKYI